MNKVVSFEDLWSLFELNSHLIALISNEGRIEAVNPSFASFLGYWPEELPGKEFNCILKPGSHIRFDSIDAWTDDHYECYYGDTISRDGSIKKLFWTITKSDKTNQLFAVAAVRDPEASSHLKLYSKQLSFHSQRLLDQHDCLRDIAWKQSHLMRMPLVNLKSLITILKEEPANPLFIQHAENELEKLDKIVKEMMDQVAKISAL